MKRETSLASARRATLRTLEQSFLDGAVKGNAKDAAFALRSIVLALRSKKSLSPGQRKYLADALEKAIAFPSKAGKSLGLISSGRPKGTKEDAGQVGFRYDQLRKSGLRRGYENPNHSKDDAKTAMSELRKDFGLSYRSLRRLLTKHRRLVKSWDEILEAAPSRKVAK